MKKFIIICVVLGMFLTTAPAEATVTFDFEAATAGGDGDDKIASANQRVTSYMTSVYGSAVTATGGAVWSNDALTGLDWTGNDTQWLRSWGDASTPVGGTKTAGAFQISFDVVPIVKISSDFYVFEDTEGADFTVKAYTSSYGDRYSPIASALVNQQSWDFGIGSDSFFMSFGSPVSLLVFSDSGWNDVAIDNLAVSPIPAPGAILLGGIGIGLVGWLKRRRTI